MTYHLWRHVDLKLHQLVQLYITWYKSRDVISTRYQYQISRDENHYSQKPGTELASLDKLHFLLTDHNEILWQIKFEINWPKLGLLLLYNTTVLLLIIYFKVIHWNDLENVYCIWRFSDFKFHIIMICLRKHDLSTGKIRISCKKKKK